MPSRKDHYHQRGSDGQRRKNTAPAGSDCASDGQDQKERAYEFRYVLIHCFLPGSITVPNAPAHLLHPSKAATDGAFVINFSSVQRWLRSALHLDRREEALLGATFVRW